MGRQYSREQGTYNTFLHVLVQFATMTVRSFMYDVQEGSLSWIRLSRRAFDMWRRSLSSIINFMHIILHLRVFALEYGDMRSFQIALYFALIVFALSFCTCEAKYGGFIVGHSNRNLLNIAEKPLKAIQSFSSKVLLIRGGKKEKKDKKGKKKVVEEAYEEERLEEEEDDSMNEDDEEESGQSNQLMSSVSELWTKTPPVTQIYIGSSIGLSFLVFVLSKNVWPEFLNLDWMKVITRFEVWRPFTAFLFFGPLGLNYLLTIHFVWTYMSQLEKLNFKAPEDFFVLIVFGAVTLLPLYSMLGLSTKYLGHNLSTYLVYIWARLFEGTDVNVMDLFLLRAEVLPWFFCAQTLVLEGEIPFADLLGIVVGHLYHYLKKRKLLTTPPAVRSLFSTDAMKAKYAKFRDDFELM